MEKTKKHVALWSGPRNISTALMYSFAQRPDTCVLDEPFFGYFLSHTGVWRPSREEVLMSMETDAKFIIDSIMTDHGKEILFMKNMANHLIDQDLQFLIDFENIILIRDPREVILSYIAHVEEPTLLDLAYKEQWELVNYLHSIDKVPIVIDSADILMDPMAQLKQLCSKLNIEFIPGMLSWPTGKRKEDGVWAKYWYESVHNSTGFLPYRKKQGEVPAQLTLLLEECQEYYERLSQLKKEN